MANTISQQQAVQLLDEMQASLQGRGGIATVLQVDNARRFATLVQQHNWVLHATSWEALRRLEGRQQAVDRQVAVLSQQGPSLSAAELQMVTALQTTVGGLQTNVTNSQRELAQLGRTTQTLQNTATSIQERQSQQGEALTRAAGGFESLDQRLAAMAGQLDSLATRAELAATAAGLQAALGHEVRQQQAALEAERQARQAAEAEVADVRGVLAALQQRLAAVEGQQAAHDIGRLQERTEVFGRMFDDIYEQVHRMAEAAAQRPLADDVPEQIAAEQGNDDRQVLQPLPDREGVE